MGLAEMGRVVRRRWYVLLPLLMLAALLTAGVDKSIPRQYQSTGMMSLLASQQSIKGTTTVPGTGNPFSSFDSSLNDTADFLVRRLASTDASQQLAGEGVGSYTAVLAASQGPFIQLTVTDSTAQGTRDSMAKLISYATTQLETLQQQQGVPTRAMITSAVIVPGSPPTAQNKRRVQDSLGAAAAGLALAVLATFAADSVAARRRRARRRARRSGVSAAAEPSAALVVPPELAAAPGPPDERASGAPEGARSAAAGLGPELISPLSEARD
ncbi:MAG TPA: hypothetical protein VH372_09720 [Actinospica sp.]|nr:hypothetical protein [Actinospica sp.]